MQSDGWPYSKSGRESSKAPSLRAAVLHAAVLRAAVFRSKIIHNRRHVLSVHKRARAYRRAGGTGSINGQGLK